MSGLTIPQHEALGAALLAIHNRLQTLTCDLSREYPMSGRVYKLAARAHKALADLRNELDNAAWSENAIAPAKGSPYFGQSARDNLGATSLERLLPGGRS